VELIDFKYIDDAITPAEALAIFTAAEEGKEERIKRLQETGYPAYITSTVRWGRGGGGGKGEDLCVVRSAV
jgi:hypothetical protein